MQQTLAVVSLGRIVKNAALLKKRAGVSLIAVVKDDAYGHGAERVSLALEPDVQGFAVATVEEGAALRVAGVAKEVLVLTPCLSQDDALRAAEYALTPTVASVASFRLLARTAEKFQFPPRAQMAVNTGMNRYGFRPDRVKSACLAARAAGMEISGIFSHLYAPQDEAARKEQTKLFEKAVCAARAAFPDVKSHLSATGGVLAEKGGKFDFVRCGIGLYGYPPPGLEGVLPLRPAMKLYAAVSGGGKFTGGGVGYARAAERYGALHTLRLGYGDGLFRAGGPGAIGKLCMDSCIREGRAAFGARRLILGNAAEYARAHGTTAYEVLVNVGKRAVKIYV